MKNEQDPMQHIKAAFDAPEVERPAGLAASLGARARQRARRQKVLMAALAFAVVAAGALWGQLGLFKNQALELDLQMPVENAAQEIAEAPPETQAETKQEVVAAAEDQGYTTLNEVSGALEYNQANQDWLSESDALPDDYQAMLALGLVM